MNKTRNKILTLTALALFSKLAFANVDTTITYANDGIDYQSITIKADAGHTQQVIEDIEYRVKSNFSQYANNEDLFFSYQNEPSSSVFNQYLIIDIPNNKVSNSNYINKVIESIKDVTNIETIYAEPIPSVAETASIIFGDTFSEDDCNCNNEYDYEGYQYYLKPSNDHTGSYLTGDRYAVGGLDGKYAWTVSGGDGSGVTVVQQGETNWNEDNRDLPKAVKIFSGTSTDNEGSYSMGVMGAKRDGYGITGFAYNASFAKAGPSVKNLPEIIKYLKAGDVIHINLQSKISNGTAGCTDSYCSVPIEYSQVWFDFIKKLTKKGIHVVEPAGNSAINLDHKDFNNRFNRNKYDSGANIVGSICASAGDTASFSNYGTRIDSNAGGCKEVATTTQTSGRYFWDYSGTGASSSVVAGAIASLSGVAKAHNKKLSPIALRKLLAKTGTKRLGSTYKYVARQPDLKKAIKRLLK